MIETYGIIGLPANTTQASVELIMAFNSRLQKSSPKFLGRYQHLQNAIELLWNEPRRQHALARGQKDYDVRKHDAFIWNDWSELMMQEFSRQIETGPSGEPLWATTIWSGNAAYKTTCAAMYGLSAFFASPTNTIVVVTSTSLPGLRKRIWKEIVRYHRLQPACGFINPTDYAIRFQKGSDESGIFGIATGQNDGDVQKAVDKIIGFHNTNVIAIVDEMQATNEAIVKACASMEAGTEHFQLIGLGNPDSELDALGQMSEPVDGYSTISVEDERWRTKRGICIHLDCYDCPRVLEGDEFYPGMLRRQDIDSKRIEEGGEDSPGFWQTRRGFIAPQGVRKTVLSPIEIRQFHAKEKAIWVSGFKLGAACDPAFEGGDRCILRIGKVGMMDAGGGVHKMGIELGEIIHLKREASKEEPIHYQIARQIQDICEQKGITPDMFAMDASGEGDGVASILRVKWSQAIMRVEFGGAASTTPIGAADSEPANKKYLYRVTELWYGFRNLVRNGQIRGLDTATEVEFCQRVYRMVGNLRQVEPKSEMKMRTKRSPDLADAVVVLAALFRAKENLAASQEGASNKSWREMAKKLNIASEYAAA